MAAPKGPWMPDSGFVFYFRQYFGFLLALVSGSLLLFGYDKGWMHNNTLSLVSLGIMLVGLLVHELRPFKRWENIRDEVEAMPNVEPDARQRRKDQ